MSQLRTGTVKNQGSTTVDNVTLDTNGSTRFGLDSGGTGNPVLFVDVSNNSVGINHATPSNGLSISGDLNITGDITVASGFVGNTDFSGDVTVNGDLTVLQGLTVDGNTLVVDDANNRVGINTNSPQGTLDARNDIIISADNVNTTAPTLRLGITNSGNQNKTAIIADPISSFGRHNLHFCLDSAADTNNVTIADSKVVIQNNGNVVIGGTTASERLDVQSDGTTILNPRISISNTSTDNTVNRSSGLRYRIGGDSSTDIGAEIIAVLLSGNTAPDDTFLTFRTGGANVANEAMRILGNKNIGIGTGTPQTKLHVGGVITSNLGITFNNNAVGGDITSVTLDDYEEGTWTPTLFDANSGGNQGSATTVQGYYFKIGNQVTCTCRVEDPDLTGLTTTAALRIRGWPYQASPGNKYDNVGSFTGTVQLQNVDFSETNDVYVIAALSNNGSYMTLVKVKSTQASQSIVVSEIPSNADIRITLTYFV